MSFEIVELEATLEIGREMDRRRDEYVEVMLADILDDVDCSPSTLKDRAERIAWLEEHMAESEVALCLGHINATLAETTHYCSGSPYTHTKIGP